MGNVSWVIATKPKPTIFCALISNALAISRKKIIFDKMKKKGWRRVSKRKREKKGQKERKRKSEKKIDSERNSYRYILLFTL